MPSPAGADRPQAVASRQTVLARAREEGLVVAGAHLPGAVWSFPDPSAPPAIGAPGWR